METKEGRQRRRTEDGDEGRKEEETEDETDRLVGGENKSCIISRTITVCDLIMKLKRSFDKCERFGLN